MGKKTSASKTSRASNTVLAGYGAYTDPGPTRGVNEDAYLLAPERQFFALADGYGGSGVGDACAKRALADMRAFVENGMGDSEVTLPFVYRSNYTAAGNLIFNAVLHANQRLVDANLQKPVNARGGLSGICAFFTGRHLTLANVGGCSAYLLRRGRVQALVRPRSYYAMRGGYSGSWNPKYGFPLYSLGHQADLEPEILELYVQPGDVIVMATDGVYPFLTEADFSEYFSGFRDKNLLDTEIQKQNQRLVEIARQKGSQDNQSMIALVCS
jgi:serine/threonine protein phosphatase PrpC